MELIRGIHNFRPSHRGCVATIGVFDGVHLGHQVILQQVKKKARELCLPSVVMVFEPHPQEFFDYDNAPTRLMRFREKFQAMAAFGVDRVVCLQFNKTLSALSAQQFVDRVLVKGLGVKHLVVGDDFRFGSDRQGDYSMLVDSGKANGFMVDNTDTFELYDERVSSTRVRAALARSDFKLAAELLGRAYSMKGRVVYGRQLGRQLGVPTANLLIGRPKMPLLGVFVVTVLIDSDRFLGKRYNGVANLGVKPTLGGTKPLLEVHLFEFNEDIYGLPIEVNFISKLRDEQQFDSFDDLTAAINTDIAKAKAFFATASS